MKILLIFTYNRSLEGWNKAGNLFREIALYEKLLEKGLDISFLTYGNYKDLNYSKILGGINVIPILEYIKSKNRRVAFLKSLFLPIKLKKIFKNIDIIKTNQMEGSWVAWLAKILYRKKLVVRGGFEWLKFYILENKIKKDRKFKSYWLRYFWRYIIEFISYRLADMIILTNPIDIDFIKKKFKFRKKSKKFHLLYNYIDVELFRPLDLEKKDKHIIYIGRLNHQKNLFNLLRALKDLEDFELDLIGGGPFKSLLIRKAKQNGLKLNFLGSFPNNKIPEILNEYQIFILPSYYEGNPKVLLEAMSCGIPSIGTDVYGINNILKHRKNGYLCNTNPDSMRDAIKTLYNDNELRKTIKINARKFVLNNCSLNLIVDKEYSLYKSLIK